MDLKVELRILQFSLYCRCVVVNKFPFLYCGRKHAPHDVLFGQVLSFPRHLLDVFLYLLCVAAHRSQPNLS